MENLFSIRDCVIVITGATGVLGSALAKYLGQQGARLAILGRTQKKVDGLVAEISRSGGQAIPVYADVTKEAELEQAREQLKNDFGTIDVLINAAGGNLPGAVIQPGQSITDANTEALKEVMELNYLGSFLPIKVFVPLFDDQGGSIINFSSMSAQRPLTRVLGYSSAKAAIDSLTQWMAIEFSYNKDLQIRVNAVAPGFFLTHQNKDLLTNKDGSLTSRGEQILQNTPMKKFGKPEDLFGAIHWLASDASKFVTGTIIPVDGGFNAYSGV